MNHIYTIHELKESTLIYNRKLPLFGFIITLIVVVFVASAVFWAAFSVKTYVVRVTGLVVSESHVNIMNRVGGAIKAVNIKEGKDVKIGDILFEIDSFQTELQIAQIESNISFYNEKIVLLERLFTFINGFTLSDQLSRVNPFSKDILSEISVFGDAQTFVDYVIQQEKSATEQDPPITYMQAEVDLLKTSYLSQMYSKVEEINMQCADLISRLQMYKDSLSEYKVIAEIDGIAHLTQGITVGTVLQAGSLLGSIMDPNPESLYFQSVLSVQDRSKILVGDGVEIAVAGLPQNEFGIVRGRVVSIDTDSTQSDKGEVYYTVKIKPEKTTLTSRKHSAELVSGMIVESRIKYDETTWLLWAIEQIGVKFR